MYRDVCGEYHGSQASFDPTTIFTDDEVIHRYKFMCPRTILRMNRILLFTRVVRKSPPRLLQMMSGLMHVKRSWCEALLADLRWLALCSDFGLAVDSDFDTWCGEVRCSPTKFVTRVRKFCKTPFANITDQWAISPTLQSFAAPLACCYCDKSFSSKQSLALHAFKAHGIKSALRIYIDDVTYCSICLREFWSRERVLNHVKYRSAVCRTNLRLRGPVITADRADEIDSKYRAEHALLARKGRRRHHMDRPSIRLLGPLLPIVLLDGQESSHHPLGRGHTYV